jgi:long-chain acyl-CoA synthetase
MTGERPVNLASRLLAAAATAPEHVALRASVHLTYRELADRVAGHARAVAGEIEPGERVAIIAGNDDSFVAAYLAVLTVGGVAVPLNPAAPDAEIGRELVAVEPALVLCGPGVGHRELPGVDHSRVRALSDLDAGPDVAGAEPFAPVDRADDDLAVLLFTAGTSGAPRPAMLTHGNLRANIEQVQSHPSTRRSGDDVVLGVLPFFHIYGLNVVLGVGLASGSTIVSVAHFDPVVTARVVAEERVTVLPAVPAIFRNWVEASVDAVPADTFASVRLAISGAAPMPAEVEEGFRRRFGVAVHDGYGLTETAPVVTTSAVDTAPRAGSIGAPLPGIEVRLVDAQGVDALAGDPGEIWVRGPNVFAGYWRDPEATAAVLEPDGWLRTGDVAVADDDGFLRLVDRIKDTIIVSGFNVFPTEVEDVVRARSDVAEVAVVGIPDERTGERVKAYVVPEAGGAPGLADIQAWCRERLARYKCPVEVEVVASLPRGLAGKVLRRGLRS